MQNGTVGQGGAVAAAGGGDGGSRRRPRPPATRVGALSPRRAPRRLRSSPRATRQMSGRRTVAARTVGRGRPRLFHVACGYTRAEGLRLSLQISPRGLTMLGRLLLIVGPLVPGGALLLHALGLYGG